MATPTPTADMIAQLRLMTAEPIASDTYTQPYLQGAIASYPVLDSEGRKPTDTQWAGAWDINQAAADIWEQKAAAVASNFDFAADGGDYKRSQAYSQMMQMARNFRARRQTGSLTMVVMPKPVGAQRIDVWIGNAAELNDDLS